MDAPLAAHGQRQQEVDQAGADQDLQSVRSPLGLLIQHEGHEGLDTATKDNSVNWCRENTCLCLQMDESARLTIIKKKRKDQSCGHHISRVASGIAINANPVDC